MNASRSTAAPAAVAGNFRSARGSNRESVSRRSRRPDPSGERRPNLEGG
jgi:hypothetical protein